MKRLTAILPVIVMVTSAAAQTQFNIEPRADSSAGPESLFGVWGNETQCRANRSGEESNPALLPYVIDGEWIRQGFIFCHLSWRGHEISDGVTLAWADARCGEDDLREYRLQLRLQDRRLSIRWSPDFAASELRACHS